MMVPLAYVFYVYVFYFLFFFVWDRPTSKLSCLLLNYGSTTRLSMISLSVSGNDLIYLKTFYSRVRYRLEAYLYNEIASYY